MFTGRGNLMDINRESDGHGSSMKVMKYMEKVKYWRK
jgi:hypothetical protein